jgi:NAD+ synthase
MIPVLDAESAQGSQSLRIDTSEAVHDIAAVIRRQVGAVLKRKGAVVAMSGGIDSSVCAGLLVRALGHERVLGLFLPERDSDPLSASLALEWAQRLGIEHVTENITPVLEACGCYQRRDAAIRRVVPEYTDGWRCKIVLPGNRLDEDRINVFQLVVQSPGGATRTLRLPPAEYREIVAATNFKQRVRKMFEYFHADRLHYAVTGTPNRLEYDQGFFVKGGDGLADFKPIAHLYKSQVYQLAEHLGVPSAIMFRPPSTDTYSLSQSQEEFFFALPFRMMDLVLRAHNAGASAEQAATELGLTPQQVERAYRDLQRKRSTTRYLHLSPLLVEPVPELELRQPDGR